MRRGWVVRTLLLKILKQLVVLPTKLGPFRKLVLAARGSQLSAHVEVLFLLRPLLGKLLRYREGERGGDAPDLEGVRVSVLLATSRACLVGEGKNGTHQSVDGCCADAVDELDRQLNNEYEDQ